MVARKKESPIFFLFERAHIFYAPCDRASVRQVPILSHGCGRCARGVPCGVWAVRACGARERARAGAGDTGDTYLKQHDAPEDVEYYLCGPPMMAKTVLDLLHSLGVDDADIRVDNFGG